MYQIKDCKGIDDKLNLLCIYLLLYLQREHSCEVPCPGECHHTAWSQWSVCHRTCVQGRPIGKCDK